MAGWVDAVGLLVKYLPELRKLVSPEARREQQERMAAVAGAADEARREAKASHDAVTMAMTQVLKNQAELQARVESSEQRTRDFAAQAAKTAEALHAVALWSRVAAALASIAIVLLIVLLLRK